MKTLTRKASQKDMPRQFEKLVQMMPPRLIHDEDQYDEVIAFLDRLLARPSRTKGQEEYVATWSVLIEDYEEQHHFIDVSKVKPLDSIRRLMEEHQMNASDLGRLLGNVSLGSKVLRGERELSKAHMRILADRFKIGAELFL